MLIAKQKRKENIIEYILYLWQLEDLLRALELNGEKIYSTLVAPLQLEEDKKQEIFFWYVSITNLLKEEQKEQSGHLNHTQHLINELNDVHLYLLKKKDPKYEELYRKALPDIETFRHKSGEPDANDVKVCLNGLYSKLLLGLKGEKLSAETDEAFQLFAGLLAYLAAKFHRFEKGEEAYKPDEV